MWVGDGSLWSADPQIQATARDRLGWLRTPEMGLQEANGVRAFVDDLRRDRFTHAVVLGMGGSSLAPEVLRETFGVAAGFLRLEALDSTDPDAIRTIERRLDLPHTLFIVASKSGTTTEPNDFMEYFWAKVPNGRQFVAITDPGSALELEAGRRGFRHVFPHQPDVGGRYAALTSIGLVPAACIGLDLDRLLVSAVDMARRCSPFAPLSDNPGVELGAVMGALAQKGCDKLTLICSPAVGTFGYWVEQLVAESTGKEGKGILPVEGEPLGPPEVYGQDRLFVYVRLEGRVDAEQEQRAAALEAAGRPVLRIDLRDRYDLGGEFFRWEFAVPVASAIIGVEPFDQPNVQESKDNTNRLLSQYIRTGALPSEPPLLTDGGLRLSAKGPAEAAIKGAGTLAEALRRYMMLVHPGDYFAFTAYLAATDRTEALLDEMRTLVRDRLHVATTTGYGPRFLHSTGQLHKGGAGNGVFVQIVSAPAHDLELPGRGYTFQTLKAAQALGDLQSLQSRGRRAIRVDIGADVDGGLRRLCDALREGLT